eukprot:scaffold162_cov474-Prasinococcus_capsulatus_cf.AAC.4
MLKSLAFKLMVGTSSSARVRQVASTSPAGAAEPSKLPHDVGPSAVASPCVPAPECKPHSPGGAPALLTAVLV